MHRLRTAVLAALLPWAAIAVGCLQRAEKPAAQAEQRQPDVAQADDEATEIRAARAELSAEDRQLVDAQDFCPVMPDKRLGVMGAPIKVLVKDQPVFLCCKGCRRKALADPDKTLAKVAEFKAKGQTPRP